MALRTESGPRGPKGKPITYSKINKKLLPERFAAPEVVGANREGINKQAESKADAILLCVCTVIILSVDSLQQL